MKYEDICWSLHKMIELLYMRVNVHTVMKHYPTAIQAKMAINDLMDSGKESETAKHWQGTQTLMDKIACGVHY